MDSSSIDFDFDIGFNNIEYNIEERIINMLKEEFGEIEIIVKVFNSYENRNIIKRIEGRYLPISFEEKVFDLIDLKSIQILIENFSLIMLRVPLFSNYNVMLYSKQEKMIDMISKKILELKSDKFDIENISNISNLKNFLLF